MLKNWFRATRTPFSIVMTIPIFVATTYAWYTHDVFDVSIFILTMLGIIFTFFGINMINDYYDHIYQADEKNISPTPFSGGSRVIQEKLISAKTIFIVAIICFSVAAIIGLYINYMLDGITILLIGIIGFFIGFFYTAPPFRFCLGPVIIYGTYFAQTQIFTINILFISILFGIVPLTVLLINEFSDYKSDKQVNKKNLVVLLGKKNCIIIYSFLWFFVFILTIVLIFIRYIPALCIIMLINAPIVIKAIMYARKYYDDEKFIIVNKLTILMGVLNAFLFTIGLIVSKLL